MANGAVYGIMPKGGGGDCDYLWDYMNSITLYNWEVEVVVTNTSYDRYQFTIKFPFGADIETIQRRYMTFVYDYGSGRRTLGTTSSQNVSFTTEYDETTSTLTVDFYNPEFDLEASGNPEYMGFLFSEITFNRSE